MHHIYFHRSKGLLSAAEALHKITRAHVKVETIPTWPNGIRRHFASPGFPLPEIEVVQGDLTLTDSFLDLAAGSRSPAKAPAAAQDSSPEHHNNCCHTCGIEFKSEADEAVDSPWIGCTQNGCPFWVHAKCAHIFYKNCDAGYKALGKWAKDHFYCVKHMPRN